MSVQSFQYRSEPTVRTIEITQNQSDDRIPGEVSYTTTEESNMSRIPNKERYLYRYGIKNIQLKNSIYNQKGIFVTKPIDVEGNIIEVSLETFEEHPLFDELEGIATDRFTSVEYYVSLVENPALNDWIPILPEGTKAVKNERLFFKGSQAELLFSANIAEDKQTNVYKNGLKLSKDDWYFTNHGSNIQLVGSYENDSIYTIDYVPDKSFEDPCVIKVNEQPGKRIRITETFENGTDYNNTIKLSKYPYIDYELINKDSSFDANKGDYRPIEVFLKNGSIAISETETRSEFYPEYYSETGEYCTKNVTNYKENKDVSLKKYNLSENNRYTRFEYKQEKNKLIFTESFNRSDIYNNHMRHHGNAEVNVAYDYLVTHLRLKIILRKNCGDELVMTPLVDKCMLKFKVMK